MSSQFERMRIMESQGPQMMTPTNYFQHLQERPNMQNEMNSMWDSVAGV